MRILAYAIFLIDFVVKTVANGDHNILMIAYAGVRVSVDTSEPPIPTSIEKHRARIENQRCQKQKNHFDRISAAINEVTVEHVRIVRRRQSILWRRCKFSSLTSTIDPYRIEYVQEIR